MALNSIVTNDWVQYYIDKFSTGKLEAFLKQCPAVAIDRPCYFSDSTFIKDITGVEKKYNFVLGFEEEYVEDLGNYKIKYHVIC